MRTLLLLIILAMLPAATIEAAPPLAKDGVLDLRGAALEQSGSMQLRGDWHFYWRSFLQPAELGKSDEIPPLRLKTPATWGSHSALHKISDRGYGTYHLRILLQEEDASRTLGLYIPSIASSYELYINGERIASAGRIGTTQQDSLPSAGPRVVYFTTDTPSLDLLVYVANFAQRKGGIWDDFKLGAAEDIVRTRELGLLVQGAIAAGMLMMGAILLIFFAFRRDKSALFFGLACVAFFLRIVYVGDMLATQIVPDIPWEVGVKIEYLSAFWGISLLVIYFYHLNPDNLRRGLSYSLAFLMIGITLPVLVLPARIYTEWMVYYQSVFLLLVVYISYGLVRAAVHRQAGSMLNLVMGLLFLATVINDILYYTFRIEAINLILLGQFLFVVAQIFMLSRKFSSAFKEVERLKRNLEDVNGNLENIVVMRTAALRESNGKLEDSERARRDLLSNIIHELGNPLTSIIGYLQRLKNGVPQGTEARHIQIAYQKARRLEYVTEDLRQLVKLEQGQFTYEFEKIKLQQFYDELQSVYDWELLDREVVFSLQLPDKAGAAVHIDAKRIEQAFTNIVNNAIAHTKPGDRIAITARCYARGQLCAIAVTDTGAGVPEADRSRIFERFYRAKSESSERYEGTGLGLTISKAIIEAHRGRIGFRSEYGRGSTFYFILPVVKEVADESNPYSDR